jgi:carboxy-cis,cis-muconate cyclase
MSSRALSRVAIRAHVATHPRGGYLYVVLEAANAVAQYTVDSRTGKPVWEGVIYPLIKPGART